MIKSASGIDVRAGNVILDALETVNTLKLDLYNELDVKFQNLKKVDDLSVTAYYSNVDISNFKSIPKVYINADKIVVDPELMSNELNLNFISEEPDELSLNAIQTAKNVSLSGSNYRFSMPKLKFVEEELNADGIKCEFPSLEKADSVVVRETRLNENSTYLSLPKVTSTTFYLSRFSSVPSIDQLKNMTYAPTKLGGHYLNNSVHPS